MHIENIDEATFRLAPDAYTLLNWLIVHAHPSEIQPLLESNVGIAIRTDLNKDPNCRAAIVNTIILSLALLEHMD